MQKTAFTPSPVSVTPLHPSFETFEKRCRDGNLISVYTELTADFETPLSAYRKVCNPTYSFLLESAEHGNEAGRYSFIGTDPRIIFTARGKEVTVREKGADDRHFTSNGDPLKDLEEHMAKYQPVSDPGLPLFHGGAVGYLAYDTVRYYEETVPEHPNDQLGVPDMVFMITDTVLIFDHHLRRIQIVANVHSDDHETPEAAYEAARQMITELVEKLHQPTHFEPFNTLEPADTGDAESNTTKEEYEEMVRKAKEYINAGDIFQVVPSQRFETPFEGDPIDLFRALRAINPSPYMFCLELEDGFSLVGSSPEVHVRSIDRKIEIRPIAGTRWRGKNEEEDVALEKDLLGDPKECAEHIMLVDLARNDVGRIADYNTVNVNELMIIERYSHVMHIVSNVVGRLREDRTAYDVMRATFPAGTVSGSPKVRAMQIINELEKSKRCAYAGAVGYFGFDGNHDSCIALRTVLLKDNKAYVQAGAGVVADSVPENEYQETVNKAMGMIRAIQRARRIKS